MVSIMPAMRFIRKKNNTTSSGGVIPIYKNKKGDGKEGKPGTYHRQVETRTPCGAPPWLTVDSPKSGSIVSVVSVCIIPRNR